MKINKVSFATMKPFHLYLDIDNMKMYRVSKVYKDKNVYVTEYIVNIKSVPIYNEFTKIKQHKVAEQNVVLSVIDLGSNKYYDVLDDKLVFSDINKAYSKFNMFIQSIFVK